LLKLDFRKAFDTVALDFLFAVMEILGVPLGFLSMVKLLFNDAQAAVCLNGGETSKFRIGRGVRQGCPLAPYLFLLVAQGLNAAVKAARNARHLQGIILPDGQTQQLIVQYADDTNFTLLGSEENLRNLTRLLDHFALASGLTINWTKSKAYWFSNHQPPGWIDSLPCSWAIPGELAKFLGVPFGIELDMQDIFIAKDP
jgi:hypothetical protein